MNMSTNRRARLLALAVALLAAWAVPPSAAVEPQYSPSTPVLLEGPEASNAGQLVTFTATVSGSSLIGTVAFLDGAATIGNCAAVPVSSSVASCTTAFLTAGLHLLNAQYSGDIGNPSGVSNHLFHTVTGSITLPVRADVNADRKADLFWRTPSPGVGLSWWTMNGSAVSGANYFEVPAEWQVGDVGDLDGDGKADLVWRRTSDGATYLWTLDGLAPKGFADLGIVSPLTWSFAGLADLDGNGKSDIVWRTSTGGGQLYAWLMDGGTIAAQGYIGSLASQWVIVDFADMDGDGKSDIVVRNGQTGTVAVWFMNGLSLKGSAQAPSLPVADWSLWAVADFDGDGQGDFLWRGIAGAGAGDTWVWIMDGATFVSGASIGNPGSAWTIRSVGDLDGDGKADIVWRHTDGTHYLWRMNGTAPVAYNPVANPGGTWQIVAP